LIGGIAVFFAIGFGVEGLRTIPGYGARPALAAGVAALMAIWWLTEALPMAVTACVPLLLFPLCGVFGKGPAGDFVQSLSPFGDAYIFLFMGGMAIGAAMEHWNLHRRIALHVMRAIGTEPRRLLLGMIVATAAVSLWISNTATAVMMVPIGVALLRQLESDGRRLRGFGCALMLSVAYASNVGGIGTKIGTGTNSIFCGYLSERLGRDVGFLEYASVGLPFVALFLPVVWTALWLSGRADAPRGGRGRAVLDAELGAMGRASRGERIVALVFLAAALAWIFGDPLRAAVAPVLQPLWPGFKLQGKHWEAAVAMTAAVALAAAGALPCKAVRRVPWSTLLLLGGSFAMAAGIEGSGLGRWMASQMAGAAALPLAAQLVLTSAGTIGLSAVASNTATVNVMLNVLPQSLPVLFAAAIAASCDFMLPAGTPPNAIVFGSGYVRLSTMMRTGVLLDLAAALLIPLYLMLAHRLHP
jgi:sodium-dependent dicarboxylate transporter 2/3/5